MAFRATEAASRRRGGSSAGAPVPSETEAAVVRCVGALLGTSRVLLSAERPVEVGGSLSVPVELADRRLWLSVVGRDGDPPFGAGDHVRLEAVAELAAAALVNVGRYAEEK